MEYNIQYNNNQVHTIDTISELLKSISNNLIDAEDGGAWKATIHIEIEY